MASEQVLTFASEIENIHLVEQMIDDVCTNHNVKEDFFGEILISLTAIAELWLRVLKW